MNIPFNLKLFLTALAVSPYISYAQDNSSWPDPLDLDFSDSDKWQVSVGLGVGYHAKYQGSDEHETNLMPLVDVEWNNLIYLNPHQGLGIYAYRDDRLTISTGIGYDMGRDESDDRDNLAGLGDIDGATALKLGVEYDLDFVEAYADFSKRLKGSNGLQVELGVNTIIPLTQQTFTQKSSSERPQVPSVRLGLSTTWADENYHQEFFGVTSLQSTRSGLKPYDIDGGFNAVNAEIGLSYPIDTHWTIYSSIEYSELIGDAADSPIVRDKSEVSGAVFLRYQF